MTVAYKNKKWVTVGHEYGDWRPKQAGFRWDPKNKVWWTDDPKKAYKLRSCITGKTLTHLEGLVAEQVEKEKQAIEASRATDANLDIPSPEGLNYLPYQRAGIAYAMNRDATLIGDEMGLGKTIQAIGLINALEATRVLVICPASLRLNWKRELEKWTTPRLMVGIATSKKFPFENVRIINYDILHCHEEKLRTTAWDIMIVDECHYLKNPKARRTKQVFGWGKELKAIPAYKRIFLTGTPMVNRPIELHPILKSIDPQRWGNWWKFTDRYCGAHDNGWSRDVKGASNLDELQDKLRATCMVRRLKADVLTELPAKRRQVIELPANGTASVVKREQSLASKYRELVAKKKLAVELAKASENKEDYEQAVAELTEARHVEFTEMAAARKETAIAKIPAVTERLNEVLDAGNKVVVFAHHHEVIDKLVSNLPPGSTVKLDGRDSMVNRDKAVTQFQENPNVKVFIGGMKAAGVGLTLTAASHVIFAELDWVPGVLSQAEDRCHRIGQTNSVLVQHLVIEGSIDAAMANTLVNKQDVLDRALDTEVTTEQRKTRLNRELREIPDSRSTDQKQETQKRSSAYDQVTEEAKHLTAQDIAHWHEGVKLVALFCDGARELDNAGFSRFDNALGHHLANTETLTPRQGVLAKRLCHKYRRQLEGSGFNLNP